MIERDEQRFADAVRIADQIWAAFKAGEPYLPALAELCALCEELGMDHADVLDDAVRQGEQNP